MKKNFFDVKNYRRQKVASDDAGRQNGRQIRIQRQKLTLGCDFGPFLGHRIFFPKKGGYQQQYYRENHSLHIFSFGFMDTR